MLRDAKTGAEIEIPRIHGNTKVRNLLTGQKDRTMAEWRRQIKASADRLIKAFPVKKDV
jgi:hypothetical protein